MDLSKINIVWEKVLEDLNYTLNDINIFNTFFKNSKLIDLDENFAYLEVESIFAKELLSSKYSNEIINSLQKITNRRLDIIFNLKKEDSFLIKKEKKEKENEEVISTFFKTNLNSLYTFENFVVGPSNQEANSASLTAAIDPGNFFNPLFIFGRSGIGKTHLLHAIGNYIQSKNIKLKIYYTSSNDFLDLYINSIRMGNITELKEELKLIDVFLMDDIQFLSGKEKTNEMFFHIFNHLINNKKQIVITSDRSPSDLYGIEERLVSRFNSGLSINIKNPEFETSVLILKKKIQLNSFFKKKIDDEVLNFIALKYSKDIRQLEGALNRLIFYADSFKKNSKVVDLEIAKEALKGLIVENNKIEETKLTLEKIKMSVAEYYKIPVNQIESNSRIANVVRARHISMYLVRTYLDLPFSKIGLEFGDRDHSTVINSCNKVDNLLKKDILYKQAMEEIKKRLNI